MKEIQRKGLVMVDEYEKQIKHLLMKRQQERDLVHELKRVMVEQGLKMRAMEGTLRNN